MLIVNTWTVIMFADALVLSDSKETSQSMIKKLNRVIEENSFDDENEES